MLPEALNLIQVGELSRLPQLHLAVHHLPKPWFLYAKHKIIIPRPEVTMIFLDGTAQESEPLTVGGLTMCLLAPWHHQPASRHEQASGTAVCLHSTVRSYNCMGECFYYFSFL